MFEITLPWGVTVNQYWGQRVAGKRAIPFLTDRARQYREDVGKLCLGRKLVSSGSALAVHLKCYPPDKRTRDLDNLCKSTLDALVHAEILRDDSDIWDLRLTRECLSAPPGRIVVLVWPINLADRSAIVERDNTQAIDSEWSKPNQPNDPILRSSVLDEKDALGKFGVHKFRMGNATEHVPRRRSPPAPTQQTSMIEDEKPF